MSSFQQVITDPPVCEKTTSQLQQQLTDENDAALPGAQLSAVTLTLYLTNKPATVINSCLARNVLGANGGTLDTEGLLTIVLAPADNVLVSQAGKSELHTALLEWTWAFGAKAGKKEITFTVMNQARVT